MKISYNYLKKYIDFDYTPSQLAERLTESGLEVEGTERYESIQGGLQGIVVGKVLTCEKHPNADKLSITTVDAGGDAALHIVCGAPNVAVGQKVLVAMVGATLYPTTGEPFKIQKSKIRGEASEGMICAEDEIGLGTGHAGILILDDDAQVGTPAADYLKIYRDVIFEIGLTPNRADAASHIGVARDIQGLLSLTNPSRLKLPDVNGYSSLRGTKQSVVDVTVQDTDACLRYSGITITNIKVGESPEWLKNFLKSIGVKSINNVVDLTNFVLHEIGQPLHAFDADKISGYKVIVKKLQVGSKFVTLDNVERELNGSELMICDEKEAMCMAGIFGGIHSGVTESTTNIFLESACFNPVDIRKASKHHGLKTDASFRFERGTDPNITIYALKRAALLLQEIAGGEVASDIFDIYPNPVNDFEVTFSYPKLFAMMGIEMQKEDVKKILTALEIKIVSESDDVLQLHIPPFKVDVQREIDVIEEVMRIYGFNKIPLPKKLNSSPVNFKGQERFQYKEKIAEYFVAQGFNEMLANSLTKSIYAEWNDNKVQAVKLLNPLSADLNVMRATLLFSALETVHYNSNRRNEDLKLFEYGNVYQQAGEKFIEDNYLSITLSGSRNAQSRFGASTQNSVYFLKSLVRNISRTLNITTIKEKTDATSPNFSQLIEIYSGKEYVGRYGLLKKSLLKKFDIETEVYYAEINFDKVVKLANAAKVVITEIPKYPEVKRDLSMLLDKAVQYEALERLAFETERKYLKRVNLFDVYEGKNIPNNKKSYALSFTLYDEEKTLQDKEIDKVMNKLMENFEKKLGAEIRK
ncbi:MAG: phenylalanine--tRNA ligase subunit beta [Bacteroidia bacterium]